MTRLYFNEVSTRDGFQIEPEFIPTDVKVELIDELSLCGYAKIEVTSFTSPKAIPMLRDAEIVMGRIRRVPGVEYTVLVPNLRGAERAVFGQQAFHAVEHRLEQGHIDHLALAGALAFVQGHQDADHPVQRGQGVAEAHAHPHRHAPGFRGEMAQSAHRLGQSAIVPENAGGTTLEAGLTVDGWAGPQTMAKLRGDVDGIPEQEMSVGRELSRFGSGAVIYQLIDERGGELFRRPFASDHQGIFRSHRSSNTRRLQALCCVAGRHYGFAMLMSLFNKFSRPRFHL